MEPIELIDAKETDYLFVQQSQLINAGQGLFTAIDIYKNELISIFKGKILTQQDANLRAQKNENHYFMNMIDGSILDCMHTYCFAKFANDAAHFAISSFKNNAIITLNEEQKVCLVATKKIKSGGEIFCSYGKAYWKYK
jgi:SET domain-containing protein